MKVAVAEIRSAARLLKAGKLVAFPTETVYGLGADAENPAAIAAIYDLKGRPSDHPLIVHVAPDSDISYWAKDIPREAFKLIEAFWPGPLTLVLKRASRIPAEVTGGQDTIGLRSPSHPVALTLLKAFKKGKGGIAAPSANRFGHISPTTAEHVYEEFGDDQRLGSVLDGGQSEVGIESTIIDLSRSKTHGAVLLRPGHITAEEIARVIGKMPTVADFDAPSVPGTLEAHYAPVTAVVIIASDKLLDYVSRIAKAGKKVAIMAYTSVMKDVLPGERQGIMANMQLPGVPEGYAHNLYASLRTLDQLHADLIIVEATPQDHAWDSINDRLQRAVFNSRGILDKILQGK